MPTMGGTILYAKTPDYLYLYISGYKQFKLLFRDICNTHGCHSLCKNLFLPSRRSVRAENHSDQVLAKDTSLPDLSWTMEKRMRLEAWTFWMRGPAGPAGVCPKPGGKRGIHFGGGSHILKRN